MAPLRSAVKAVISIVNVVRSFPLCPHVSFQHVRIVIHLVLFRNCDRHYQLIRGSAKMQGYRFFFFVRVTCG